MEFLSNFQEVLTLYGFPAVFILLFLEMVGIPFPAESILIFVGVTFQQSDLIWVCLLAFSGHVFGSSVGYWLGRSLGRGILVRFGPYVKITEERLLKAEKLFNDYKIAMIAFAKFIAFVRIIIPFLAGINRMSFAKFTFINSISSAIWVVLFVYGGFFVTEWIRSLEQSLENHPYLFSFAFILIFFAIWKWKQRKNQV